MICTEVADGVITMAIITLPWYKTAWQKLKAASPVFAKVVAIALGLLVIGAIVAMTLHE